MARRGEVMSILEDGIANLRAEAATWRTLFLRATVSLKAASTVTEGTLTKCRECRAWYNDSGNCTHERRCQTGNLLGLADAAQKMPPGFYPAFIREERSGGDGGRTEE
jgi:predicted anti-sigma-YlaC factor YlaD